MSDTIPRLCAGLELHSQILAMVEREMLDGVPNALKDWCAKFEALLTSLQASVTERERAAEWRATEFQSAWRDEERAHEETAAQLLREARAYEETATGLVGALLAEQEALRLMTARAETAEAQLCGRGYVTHMTDEQMETIFGEPVSDNSADPVPEPTIAELAARLGIPPEEWEAKRQATLAGCAARERVSETSAAELRLGRIEDAAEDTRLVVSAGRAVVAIIAAVLVYWACWQVRLGLTWPGW